MAQITCRRWLLQRNYLQKKICKTLDVLKVQRTTSGACTEMRSTCLSARTPNIVENKDSDTWASEG